MKKIIVTNCTIRTVKGGGGGEGEGWERGKGWGLLWGFPNTLLSRAPALIEKILMTLFLAARELVELWEHIITFFVRLPRIMSFFSSHKWIVFLCAI
jgi:hypothetical protein